MPNSSPKRLGRYEIVTEIGRGAMGAVYKGRDPKIDRFVAIKSISAISQSSEEEEREYRDRFVREAQAAGRLLHPGIVTVFDVGEDSQTHDPYLVMEYVSGQTLSSLLSGENNKLTLEHALRLAEEIAVALDCAHAQGVVHRDIKPANILLTEDGHAKIADFGIAKLNFSNMTLPGLTLGTPAYMSPEQVDGKATDGRSDLFSLGVILYNMVTGHRPFQGTSAVTVCYKVANAEPLPATSFDLALPPEIDAVISKAIAKDPAERFQRGEEFATAIREVRQQISGGGRTRVPARKELTSPRKATPAGVTATARVRVAASTAQGPSDANPDAQPELTKPYLVLASFVVALGFVIIRYGIPFVGHKEQADLPKASPPSTRSIKSLATPKPALPVQTAEDTPAVKVVASTPVVAAPKPRRVPSRKQTALSTAPTPPQAEKPAPAEPPAVLPSARLKIEVQHHFTEGKLSLWVDEKLAYSSDLHGSVKKRLALFRDVSGSDSAEVPISAGKHTLRVHGESGAHNFDESKTITADFETGGEKVLRVNFTKDYRELTLAVQ